MSMLRISIPKTSAILYHVKCNDVRQYIPLTGRHADVYHSVTNRWKHFGMVSTSNYSTTQSNIPIANFYAGKSVFVTGGTGFLGKVLIEKLLYSCPDLERVYMLIRPKKGLSIDQRVKEFASDSIFKRLNSSTLQKIIPIAGDVNVPKLGISDNDEQMLLENVTMVVHSAAVIKFNDKLKADWITHVEGTRMMLDLSRRMKRIEVFVHVSTAYTNTDRVVIEEVLYPPPADIETISRYVKKGISDEETRKILNGRPNTYTFTKALTEHIVAENQKAMPTIIVRPAAVASMKNDPMPGWVGHWFGPTGIATNISRGLNKVVYGKKDNILDLIPVDYVSNLIIVAGARGSRPDALQIYNSCSSSCNPVALGKFFEMFVVENSQYKNSFRLPLASWYIYTTNKWVLSIATTAFQTTPAYIADLFRHLQGKKPKYVKIQSIVISGREVLDFFSSHSWVMKADNVRKLHSSLSPTDQKLFPCDPTDIKWDDYLKKYLWGVRKYLEKRE